jgi:hypothetical protein
MATRTVLIAPPRAAVIAGAAGVGTQLASLLA